MKLDFFPHETQFFGHFVLILHFLIDFREKIEWGDPFYAIFKANFWKTAKIYSLLSINRGHHSKNEEVWSQE